MPAAAGQMQALLQRSLGQQHCFRPKKARWRSNADQLSVISLLLINKSPLTLSHIWRKEKEEDEQHCCARNSMQC